jgi:quercetin dioxygenase-like cupin family protein
MPGGRRFVMKRTVPVAAFALVAAGLISPVFAADDHKMLRPNDVKWSPAPPVLPKGAEASVLHGDPTKEGFFAMRLKFPAGYRVPAHTHPVQEVVTVISGNFKLGMGPDADRSKAQDMPAGSLFAFSPGMPHFAYTDEETVVQITTNGPWGLNYVHAKDDPRQKTQ